MCAKSAETLRSPQPGRVEAVDGFQCVVTKSNVAKLLHLVVEKVVDFEEALAVSMPVTEHQISVNRTLRYEIVTFDSFSVHLPTAQPTLPRVNNKIH